MLHKKVNQYSLWAWILVAISAPAAQLASSGPWLGVLVLAVVCGSLCWAIHAIAEEQPDMKRWFCALEFLFLILISAKFTHMAANCWPTGNSYPTVSLTLLILAAFSALDGANRASRIGGVLFWFLAILYVVILGAGVKDLHVDWLSPSLETPRCFLVVVFLAPVLASFLPREKGVASSAAWITTCVFATVIALWTAGTMSPALVGSMLDPFYEFSRSLSLFGVAERFEAIVSVALTLGYFALLSLLFSVSGHLVETIQPGRGKAGVVICAAGAAVVMLLCPKLSELWLALLAALFWGVLPLFTQLAAKIKKSKKLEKRT